MRTRETKYIQGQEFPRVSFTWIATKGGKEEREDKRKQNETKNNKKMKTFDVSEQRKKHFWHVLEKT